MTYDPFLRNSQSEIEGERRKEMEDSGETYPFLGFLEKRC